HGAARHAHPPQPKPATLTFNPVRPNVVYSIFNHISVPSSSSTRFASLLGRLDRLERLELLEPREFHSRVTRMPNTSPVAHTCPPALSVQLTQAFRPSIFVMRALNCRGALRGVGFR